MKIFCVGRNYIDHAKELNNIVPKEPIIFLKPETAILKNNNPFFYPSHSKEIHYEAELVLKICRLGKNIQKKYAHKYFDEVAVGIDFTARDIQKRCKEKGLPWEMAKAFDHSAVIGTFEKVATLKRSGILFSLTKNGDSVQQGNSKDMIFDFGDIISYISTCFTLKLGDLIFTGTPAGVGEVKIGDYLEGFLGDAPNFKCAIR